MKEVKGLESSPTEDVDNTRRENRCKRFKCTRVCLTCKWKWDYQRMDNSVVVWVEQRRYRCWIQRELYSTEKGGAVHRSLHSTGCALDAVLMMIHLTVHNDNALPFNSSTMRCLYSVQTWRSDLLCGCRVAAADDMLLSERTSFALLSS